MNDMKENKIHTETKWFQRLFDYTIYQQEKLVLQFQIMHYHDYVSTFVFVD